MSAAARFEPVVFARRRALLMERFAGAAAVIAGLRQPRNCPAMHYPYRASSHFLYLVGRPLPGAILWLADGRARLHLVPQEPGMRLWNGPEASPAELERELEVEVRSLAELPREAGVAVLPPSDHGTAVWAEALLGRRVVAGGGASLTGGDAALADALIELRLRHDDAAVAELRRAAAVTAAAHRAGMAATHPGGHEAAVRGAMVGAIETAGMVPAYAPIVTTHGDVLHQERSDRSLEPGSLLLADVGAETEQGWAADVTRTWPVEGRFSLGQRELYEVVLAAQREAIAAVRPGAPYAAVHETAQRAIVRGLTDLGVLVGDPHELWARGAAALFFPHGIGHLLGLDVHDLEDLGDRAGYGPGAQRRSSPGWRYLRLDRVLEPGMVVTVEPGLYRLPDDLLAELGPADAIDAARWGQLADVRGIRIEDDVLVTESGAEVLTASIPKSVAELEGVLRP